jgi:hypothetical protein
MQMTAYPFVIRNYPLIHFDAKEDLQFIEYHLITRGNLVQCILIMLLKLCVANPYHVLHTFSS